MTSLIRAFMLVLLVPEIAWHVEQQNNIYIYIYTHKITHLPRVKKIKIKTFQAKTFPVLLLLAKSFLRLAVRLAHHSHQSQNLAYNFNFVLTLTMYDYNGNICYDYNENI